LACFITAFLHLPISDVIRAAISTHIESRRRDPTFQEFSTLATKPNLHARQLAWHHGIMVAVMEVAMSESPNNEDRGQPERPKAFEIKIDRTSYKVHDPVLTGAQLRQRSHLQLH
jgi:hypothetical protein